MAGEYTWSATPAKRYFPFMEQGNWADACAMEYQQAGVDIPPTLLYANKDCCSQSGASKYQVATHV